MNKKIILFIFIYCLVPNIANGEPTQLLHNSSQRYFRDKIAQNLKQVIYKSKIKTRRLGIMVVTDNKVIYQLNSHQSFIPASLTKIFTAGALLDLLSPSLHFRTQFLAKSFPKEGVLDGHLYLKGGGDPSFVSESLWNLVNHLTRTRLKTVNGDLVLDDTLFDRQHKSQRLSYSSHDSYDAPVGALSFNWSTANIYIRPGNKIGDNLHVVIDPSDLYFSSIKNQTKTLAAGKKRNVTIEIKKRRNKKTIIYIRGGIPLDSDEILLYRSISYPTLWTGWNAFSFLKQRQIIVKGRVRRGKVPLGAIELAQWRGRSLIENIQMMMKYSNNFMVEILVKNLAVYRNNNRIVKVNSSTCDQMLTQRLSKHNLQSSGKDAAKPRRNNPSLRARRKNTPWVQSSNKYASEPRRSKHPLGARRSNPLLKGGTLEGGTDLIKQHIQKCLKISKGKYRLAQPSGLSRLNRFQPRHLMKALKYWVNHPLQAEFESALPLAGHSGTLKGRLLTVPATVHAKTGHLSGVVGLAGYIRAISGKKYLFVFMFNGPDKQSVKAEKLFEQIAQTVLQF